MSLLEALILGLIQGVTEFLPISSSGHLVLAESLLNLEPTELLTFDIVTHLGTLLAVLYYFRTDIWRVLNDSWQLIIGKLAVKSDEGQLVLKLIIGTVPLVIVGVLWPDSFTEFFRQPRIVAALFIVSAVYFWLAEARFNRHKVKTEKLAGISWGQAILVGLSQAVAILPGISRSGSTLATAVLTGVKRDLAARFSFLLGSIAIAAAGSKLAYDQLQAAPVSAPADLTSLLVGFVVSAVAGYLVIKFLMNFFKTHTLRGFAVYLLIIGIISLIFT